MRDSCKCTLREVSRRSLLAVPLTLAAGPRCCETPELAPDCFIIEGDVARIDLRRAPQLARAGGSARLVVADRKLDVLIVRTGKAACRAISGRCTHGTAPLNYNPRHRSILCSSFGHSEFDMAGTVLRGPAPRPIPVYESKVVGHTLEIRLAVRS
jgi:nitrite reductase/ring-hydroxylating ferredoxin subunit